MPLFDDVKKLEKAREPEAAEAIAHIFEKHEESCKNEPATRKDLEILKAELKHDLTVRLGAMMAAAVAAVVKLL